MTRPTTASFAYIRWHGSKAWYSSRYSRHELQRWADIIRNLPVQHVYGYFNNDTTPMHRRTAGSYGASHGSCSRRASSSTPRQSSTRPAVCSAVTASSRTSQPSIAAKNGDASSSADTWAAFSRFSPS